MAQTASARTPVATVPRLPGEAGGEHRRGGERPPRRRAGQRRLVVSIKDVSFLTTALALVILFLAPLLWTSYASVHGPQAANGNPGYGIDHYRRLFGYGSGLPRYLFNSIAVSAMTVAGTLTIAVLAGYAIARFRFFGRNVLFLATLSILMVPYPTILVPLYVLMGKIHLQNSLVGLALVLVVFQLPFALFMTRNAFEGVPRELDEAARVDGAGAIRVLRSVLLPAVVPALVTVSLFAFIASWNEFIAPLILLSDDNKFTVPIALAAMRSGSHGAIDYGSVQAGTLVSAIPCMIVFAVLQRHYVRGFASGALKG